MRRVRSTERILRRIFRESYQRMSHLQAGYHLKFPSSTNDKITNDKITNDKTTNDRIVIDKVPNDKTKK